VAGLVGRRWAGAAYSASKGAVRIFSKATAMQYAPDRIRCNSIHPGPIQTLMLGVTDNDPTLMATRLAEIPLGRIGTVDDVASGALFLASDESSWITGIELTIDGGVTAQ
jgi:cyclopentanol dehydrogenase